MKISHLRSFTFKAGTESTLVPQIPILICIANKVIIRYLQLLSAMLWLLFLLLLSLAALLSKLLFDFEALPSLGMLSLTLFIDFGFGEMTSKLLSRTEPMKSQGHKSLFTQLHNCHSNFKNEKNL